MALTTGTGYSNQGMWDQAEFERAMQLEALKRQAVGAQNAMVGMGSAGNSALGVLTQTQSERTRIGNKVAALEKKYMEAQNPTTMLRCVKRLETTQDSWYFQVRTFSADEDVHKEYGRWNTYNSLADIRPPGLRALALSVVSQCAGMGDQMPKLPNFGAGVEATAYADDDLVEPRGYVVLTLTGPEWSCLYATKENGGAS